MARSRGNGPKRFNKPIVVDLDLPVWGEDGNEETDERQEMTEGREQREGRQMSQEREDREEKSISARSDLMPAAEWERRQRVQQQREGKEEV